MSTIYILTQNVAFNESYAVDIRIKYISFSKEKVEKEMERLCNEFDNKKLEEYRKICIDNYKNHPEWYGEHAQIWDSTTKRYVPWAVDLAVAEYKRMYHESIWIDEIELDFSCDVGMGSYYE